MSEAKMSEAKMSEAKPARRKAAAPPGDLGDTPAYLLDRGWRPEGDPAAGPTRWLDPERPTADTYTEVAVGTRRLPSGKAVTVYQTCVEPAAWPLPEAEAVRVQRERDAA